MINLLKSNLYGDLNIISSKSIIHRYLFLSVLANQKVLIKNVSYNDDINATINVLRKCNASIETYEDYIIVNKSTLKILDILNVNESGSTLRFIIPFVLLLNEKATIIGENNLNKRPIFDYFNIFKELNVEYYYNGSLPLSIKGKLKPKIYNISSKISSQFISGLLLTLPFLNDVSIINITDDFIESKPYIDLTISILKEFNINILNKGNSYIIHPFKSLTTNEFICEADFTHSAIFLLFNALGSKINIKNINPNSKQGDSYILDILKESGIILNNNYNVIKNDFNPLNIDLSNNPDLAICLAIYALFLRDKSTISGLKRLKYKESDRLQGIIDIFNILDVKYELYNDDKLIIYPKKDLKKASFKTYNDHRFAMALSLLTTKINIKLDDIKCINKSYPTFFKEYQRLNGVIYED